MIFGYGIKAYFDESIKVVQDFLKPNLYSPKILTNPNQSILKVTFRNVS